MRTLPTLALILIAACTRKEELALTPEAADAYVDFAAFVAAKVQGVELELTPEQHQRAVELLRENWSGANPDWQRLVLRSPELYVLTLQAWRAADEPTREHLRDAWAQQLRLPRPARSSIPIYKSKTLSLQQQQALIELGKMNYEATQNVMRAYRELPKR